MELKNKRIHFLGDSITEGSSGGGPGYRFSDLIAQKYGAVCNNYGVGGSRIARQHLSANADWDRDFCMRAEEMDPEADVIVIFGGTNDYGHGDAPIGIPSDRTPMTFYGALHTLYSFLLERYPHARIVVITPMHRLGEWDPRGNCKPEDVLPLKGYVDIIREVAEWYSLPVLDLYKESGLQPEVPAICRDFFLEDGLHPNTAGHVLLAEQIGKFLENLW